MTAAKDIAVIPAITAGAYHAGDAVGGLMTFVNAASVYRSNGKITKVVLVDDANQKANLKLWLFNQTIASAAADNAPFDPTDADLEFCIGCIDIPAANYMTATDNSVASVDADLDFVLVAGGSSLFGQFQCVATPTYVAVTDITCKITVER